MRRRNPRVVWLPQTNANSVGGLSSAYQVFRVDVSGVEGDFAVGEIPLVIDGEGDPLAATNTLSDIESSGYRLRRIVGKIFARVDQVAAASPFLLAVTAGIIVRRSNDQTGASLAVETLNEELVAPSQIRNSGDPWIWRRTWLLGNNKSLERPPSAGLVEEGNTELGSAVDGPHVDQKTARIIGPEERLFLDVSATVVQQDAVTTLINTSTLIVTNLRVLGSMRSSSGNRRNASR